MRVLLVVTLENLYRRKVRNIFLQKLKRIEKAHSTFITGLEFLPTSEETDAIRGFSDASVVSISVDHLVCIHHVPRLRKNFSIISNAALKRKRQCGGI